MPLLMSSSALAPRRAARRLPALLALFCLTAGALSSGAQDRQEQFIGPGVRRLSWSVPDGPVALQAIEMDRAEAFVRLGVSQGMTETFALAPLSQQAARLTRPDRYPIAGVNGDFFYYPNTQQSGIPTSAAVLDGELLRTPFPRSCLILDENGAPRISILQARGLLKLPGGSEAPIHAVNAPRKPNQLVVYTPRYGATTRTDPGGVEVYLQPEEFPLRHGMTHRAKVRAVQQGVGGGALNPGTWVLSGSGGVTAALKGLAPNDVVELRVDFTPNLGPRDQVLGGGPRLVRDGKAAVEAEGGAINGSFASTRHPRTAIGFNGSKVFLVVADGRRPGVSVGMSLPELAQEMVDLGCTDAMNMDGGGSTVLWIRGEIANKPSDGRERPVANGLLVFSSAPKGDPVRLVAEPAEIAALPGAELPLFARGQDRYYNPVSVPAEKIAWTVDPALGSVRNGRFVAGEPLFAEGQEAISGTLRGESAGVSVNIPVRLYAKPAVVTVLPAATRLGTQLQSGFRVTALNAQGRPLALPSVVQWEATPAVGRIDSTGTLVTGEGAGEGVVTATIAGVSGSAMVSVSETFARALEDFESGIGWSTRTSPGTVGSARVAMGPARSGKQSLRLEYDFGTGSGTRAVYAIGSRPLGAALALKVWAYGDGQGAWLRARVRDAKGGAHTVDLARNVDWKDSWRELRAPFSDDLPTPLTLESVYVVEPDTALKQKGSILIDDVSVDQ